MSASNPPRFIYKILPGPTPDPLPAELPLSQLDKDDGYIHLSTSAQLPKTADRFFTHTTDLHVLKLEYARVEPSIRWEGQEGNQFPHLHGRNFGAGEVVSSHCFVRAGTQAWSDAVKGDSWLE